MKRKYGASALLAACAVSSAILVGPAASAQTSSGSDSGSVPGSVLMPVTGVINSTANSSGSSPIPNLGSLGSLSSPAYGDELPVQFITGNGFSPTCTPSRLHPVPVVLVHGSFGKGVGMAYEIGRPLARQGFCVVAPTFGAFSANPGLGLTASIKSVSAPQLASVIDRVMEVTGSSKVDLMGLSQGASVAGYVAKVLRPQVVQKVVSLGGYWGRDPSSLVPGGLPAGSSGPLLKLASIPALAELLPGASVFTEWMGENKSPYAPGVEYILIASEYDQLMPPERSFVPGPGVKTISVQDGCARNRVNHEQLIYDARTVELVVRALGGWFLGNPPCES